MIISTGVLKMDKNKKDNNTRVVKWSMGELSGDKTVIFILQDFAKINSGKSIPWHGRVIDWIKDPVAYGILLLKIFENDTLYVVATDGERLAPPPCPDNAVC